MSGGIVYSFTLFDFIILSAIASDADRQSHRELQIRRYDIWISAFRVARVKLIFLNLFFGIHFHNSIITCLSPNLLLHAKVNVA